MFGTGDKIAWLVEAVCYKLEARRFAYGRSLFTAFSIDIILLAELCTRGRLKLQSPVSTAREDMFAALPRKVDSMLPRGRLNTAACRTQSERFLSRCAVLSQLERCCGVPAFISCQSGQ
jgi:hypothetical protein